MAMLAARSAWAAPPSEGLGARLTVWVDTAFGHLVEVMTWVLFFEVVPGTGGAQGLPFIIVVLFAGGIFFTLRYGFINVRLFGHGFAVIRGKYDLPGAAGEISHFKALTSALSATVGLGNIAGVAVAISLGGPGAIFWMWLTAFFGMSLKFSSCTLAQMYRRVHPDGRVLGGPMVYLEEGLARDAGLPRALAKTFGVVYAVFVILASFGVDLFQGNQTYSILAGQFYGTEAPGWLPWTVGAIMSALVGVVIIGGIRRIGEVTCRLVPAMLVFYCAVCLVIIGLNLGKVPGLIAEIAMQAWAPDAAFGGFLGVLVQGMRRAAFSNEAGLGSAAIAHAAARTKEPVREGVVAMLGPFIDTIVVCTMTALAVLITEAHLLRDAEDIQITAAAFGQLGPSLPYLLCLAVMVFAYSTIISWGYYGEQATEYLVGPAGIRPYRIAFVVAVVFGPVFSLIHVLGFADLVMLSMAFPNIIGMLFLSGRVRAAARDYTARLTSGAVQRTK